MREILFRGKANDGCCWVCGHYAVLNDGYRPDWKRHYILSGELRYNDQYGAEDIRKVEIDPKTLGQYTGQKDKNGKRIFEGDIVRCESGRICKVVFFTSPQIACFDLLSIATFDTPVPTLWNLFSASEVIGNIHDDPELIGGMIDENA